MSWLFSNSFDKPKKDPEDEFYLKRFLQAQDKEEIYFQALSELWDGKSVLIGFGLFFLN